MTQIEAATSDEVRDGAVFAVTLNGTRVGLTRAGGAVQAFVNRCPHLGLRLTNGKIENGVITCPFHGSSFDLCTGADKAWIAGFMGLKLPGFLCKILAMGKTPQGLTKLPATEADGKIYITMA